MSSNLIIEITLQESGGIAGVHKDFNIFAGSYITGLSVAVPKFLLSGKIERIGTITDNIVSFGGIGVDRTGKEETMEEDFLKYVRYIIRDGKEYAIYIYPAPLDIAYTRYAGEHSIVVNVTNIITDEDGSRIERLATSQEYNYTVLPSGVLKKDKIPDPPTELQLLAGRQDTLEQRMDEAIEAAGTVESVTVALQGEVVRATAAEALLQANIETESRIRADEDTALATDADNKLVESKGYTDTKLTSYLTEQETYDVIKEEIAAALEGVPPEVDLSIYETVVGANEKTAQAEQNAKDFAQQLADGKVDKVAGKGLSTNDLTDERMIEYSQKQNKLIAGDNITFSGDVISASVGGVKSATLIVGFTDDCDYKITTETDHQIIINQAITALPATGGKVILREGVYLITSNITVNKVNVTIEGMGNATELRRMLSFVNGIIYITSNYCSVERLYVNGNNIDAAVTTSYGIRITASNVNITSVVSNNNYVGISTNASSYAKVVNSTCNSNYSTGISTNGSTGGIAMGNVCNNNSRGIYGSYTGIVCNNICTLNTNVGIDGGRTITGNLCTGNTNGIQIAASGCTATGNTCNSNTNYGIQVSTVDLYGCVITGNTCNANATGINVIGGGGSGGNNTVASNTCDLNTNMGVNVNCSRNNISANTCYQTVGTACINIASGTANLVANNKVYSLGIVNNGTNTELINNSST